MEIIIAHQSDTPIYEQIVAQIRSAIFEGTLHDGEKLPSIRSLANDLQVSVITTKRAYTDLEEQGFIETIQGRGSFVAGGNKAFLQEQQRRSIEALLTKAIAEAENAGIDGAELREMLDVLLES